MEQRWVLFATFSTHESLNCAHSEATITENGSNTDLSHLPHRFAETFSNSVVALGSKPKDVSKQEEPYSSTSLGKGYKET